MRMQILTNWVCWHLAVKHEYDVAGVDVHAAAVAAVAAAARKGIAVKTIRQPAAITSAIAIKHPQHSQHTAHITRSSALMRMREADVRQVTCSCCYCWSC